MRTSKNNKYSKIGKKIKKRLIDKDMTAKELADALNISPQYLNKILHGERTGKKYIQAIAEILEMDIAA